MAQKYRHTILLVDDEEAITKAINRLFRKEGHQILTASSGREGLGLLKKVEKPVSLIISDQRMPEMTGAQFLEKAKEIFPDAIRFLLTGYSDMDAIIDAVNKGEIHRYLTKPWNDDDLMLQVRQSLEQHELVLENRRLLALTKKQNKELGELNRDLEKKVNERTLELKQNNRELQEANEKLEEGFLHTIRLYSTLVETLNPALGKYMREAAKLSRSVAEELGLDKEDLDQIEIAGMIHDIGLLGSPGYLIEKDESDMTEKEFKIFNLHPAISQVCVDSVERLNRVGEMILFHHEHYDGSGFPNGLRSEEIPLGSRIIGAVADYCWMVNFWPKDLKEIIKRSRRYFGPAVKDLGVMDPKTMIEEVAKKIIMLGGNQKYDFQIVSALIKKLGEMETDETKRQKQISLLPVDELQEGMVLAKNLRTEEGRILLAKDTKLNESSLESIQNLAGQGVIKNQIHVILSSNKEKNLSENKLEEIRKQKQISLVPLAELQEGMVLAKNLRIEDGRILFVKDAKLSESSLESIQKLATRGLIKDHIHVRIES